MRQHELVLANYKVNSRASSVITTPEWTTRKKFHLIKLLYRRVLGKSIKILTPFCNYFSSHMI